MTDHAEAFRAFRQSLDLLLQVHGLRFGEHSRLIMDARPGVLVLLEADAAEGDRPRLILTCDERQPETFGRRLAEDAWKGQPW